MSEEIKKLQAEWEAAMEQFNQAGAMVQNLSSALSKAEAMRQFHQDRVAEIYDNIQKLRES